MPARSGACGGVVAGFYERIGRHRPRAGRGPRHWVFLPYDQLRPDHPLLAGPPRETGVVYVETAAKPARRPYHKQKLVLLLSAMRHDALERARRGYPVLYRFSERWYDGALDEVRSEFGLEALTSSRSATRTASGRAPASTGR